MNITNISKFKVADAFKHLPTRSLGEGITAGGFPSIRYRGKAWSLQYSGKNYAFRRADDNTPMTYIDVIILADNPFQSRVYFEGEGWTEDSASGPVCQSLRSDVPDPGVPIPQSKTCPTCSHSQWVQQPNGSKKPECQNHKRVAVLLMPYMTEKLLGTPLMEPVYLKIPPGSLKTYKLYGDELQGYGFPPASLVTRISFSQERIFEMNFDIVQMLTDDEAPLVLEKIEEPQVKQILGSAPEVREALPEIPKGRIETGLLSAFGKAPAAPAAAPPKKMGRPPGTPNKPKTIEGEILKPAPVAAPVPAAEVAETAVEAPWEEADTDLDDTVNALLGEKMGGMMK